MLPTFEPDSTSTSQPTPPRARTRRRLAAVAAVAAVVGLLGAGGAQAASTIDYDHAGGTITITGSGGEESILLNHGGGQTDPSLVGITDFEGSTLTPAAVAAGCVEDEPYSDWVCPRPARVVASLGAGDDSFGVYEDDAVPFTVPLEVDGGAGDDRIDGASGHDVIYGGPGDDKLTGRGGDDRIFGQDGNDILNGDWSDSYPGGNDHLDGGAGDDEFETYVGFGYPASLSGDDTYVGGPGNDSFSYFTRSAPVSISLDGVANDGIAGEADNIQPDIETVGGGSGNDVIVGSPGDDHLWGSDGDDRIYGLGGNDKLDGNEGDDLIDGGPGDDELDGGCMTDTLIGGPGADSFNSDGSCDRTLRSPFDVIDARDGAADKLIFCQWLNDPAGDTALVDAVDPVTSSGPGACGTIEVAAAAGDGGGGGGGSGSGGDAGGTGAGRGGATAVKGKRRAALGKTVVLLTGNGKQGRAAKPAINLKRKRLTLGTLRATKTAKVAATATVRLKRRTVRLGRTTVTVKARTTRTLQLRLSPAAVRALKGVKKARVTTTFKLGKKRYRKAFAVPVARK